MTGRVANWPVGLVSLRSLLNRGSRLWGGTKLGWLDGERQERAVLILPKLHSHASFNSDTIRGGTAANVGEMEQRLIRVQDILSLTQRV
jgi:hypothetical protein